MKETLNLSRVLSVAAFLGLANAASAQTGVLTAGGQVTDNFVCVIGEPFVSQENAGFLADAYDIPTGVKSVYAAGDVKFLNSGDGELTLTMPEKLVKAGAAYCVYSMNGALLSKVDVLAENTTVKVADIMRGKAVVVAVVAKNGGKLASVKLSK